jgi:hypothetical protein
MTNASAFVQIVTWNDYGEDIIVEPTREYGFRDLGIIQDYRRKYLDPRFAYRAIDLLAAQTIRASLAAILHPLNRPGRRKQD